MGLSTGSRLDGVLVLVVDDTPYVLQVVADILTGGGGKVRGRFGRREARSAAMGAPRRASERPRDAGKRRVLADPADSIATAGACRRYPCRRPHRLRRSRVPRERAAYGIPAPCEKPLGLEALIGAVALLPQQGSASSRAAARRPQGVDGPRHRAPGETWRAAPLVIAGPCPGGSPRAQHPTRSMA